MTDPDQEVGASIGASIQLAARGQQDVYLTLNPDITFFRTVFKRHTPFAVTTFAEEFSRGFQMGAELTLELPRRGDALGDVTVEIELPVLGAGARWVPSVARVLLRRARLLVDDTVVHDHERLWYDVSDKLFGAAGHAAGMREMLGGAAGGLPGLPGLDASVPHTLYAPLKFLCCRSHHDRQAWLPLAAAPGSRVTVQFETETLANCCTGYSPPAGPSGGAPAAVTARVLYDVVFLGDDERRAMLAKPMTIIFENVQDMDAVNYKLYAPSDASSTADVRVPSTTIDLSELNHNVKLLAWVAYAEQYASFFEYVDAVKSAVLLIGSQPRFAERPGTYFELAQPYAHCRRCAADHVGAYSFALDASSRQPAGSVNFASLAKPALRVTLRPGLADRVKVKVFALGYNFLVVDKGRATVKF